MKEKRATVSVAPVAGCRFCAIARGEVPSYIVFDDDVSLAFLDHRPLFPGHCLLIPREHHETLANLPRGLIPPFFGTVQLLAKAIELGMEADGTFVAINNRVSQSVPHFHVHIVPRRRKDGLRGFFWPRQRYESENAIGEVQARLRSAISRLK
jgi:histidine triad (HIT) family protein